MPLFKLFVFVAASLQRLLFHDEAQCFGWDWDVMHQ